MSYPILHENPKGRTNLQNSNSLTNEIFENLGRDQQNDCAQTDKKESFFLDFLDFSSSSDNSPKVVGRNYYGNSGKSNSECNNFLLDTLTREESDLAEYSKINSVPSKMKHFSFDETKKSYLIKNFLNEKGDFWNNGSNSETTQKPNYPINKANPIIVMDPDDLFNLSDKLRTRTSKLIQGLVLEEINCVKKGAKEPSLDSSETTQSVTKLQNFLNEMDSELVAFINSEIRQESLISLMNNTSIDELWSVYNMLRSHIIMAMTSNHICFVVQKIIEMSNKKLRLSIIKDISEGILEVAMNPRGNHTLQCLVSSMTYNDEISYFMSLVFSDNNKFHEMCKDKYAIYIIKCIVEKIPLKHRLFLNNYFINILNDLIVHVSGIIVVCSFIANAKSKSFLNQILQKILKNLKYYSQHKYARYAIQQIIELQIPEVTSHIFYSLYSNLIEVSKSRHGSSFIEFCLSKMDNNMITRFAMLLFRPESISEVLKNIFSGYVIKNITKRIDPQTKAQIKYILSCEFIPNNNKEEKLVRKLIGKFN